MAEYAHPEVLVSTEWVAGAGGLLAGLPASIWLGLPEG